MGAIISTDRGGRCFCLDDFNPGEPQVTHVGGESHDGFHRECLKEHTVQKGVPYPPCPHCQKPIDPSALFSETEQTIMKPKSAVTNTAYAAGFVTLGLGLTMVATTILAMIPTVMITAIETTGLETGIIVPQQTITTVAIGGATIAGLILAIEPDHLPRAAQCAVTISIVATAIGGAWTVLAQMTAKTIGTILVESVVTKVLGAGIGIGGTLIGGTVGGLYKGILEIRKFDQINNGFIGCGMYVGSLVGIAAIPFISLAPTLTVCIVGSIVGGIAAGIFTLIGR